MLLWEGGDVICAPVGGRGYDMWEGGDVICAPMGGRGCDMCTCGREGPKHADCLAPLLLLFP